MESLEYIHHITSPLEYRIINIHVWPRMRRLEMTKILTPVALLDILTFTVSKRLGDSQLS